MAACLPAVALAQPAPQPSNVPTVTRLVKVFSELERGLVEKSHSKDASDLDALLDPSFEMRIGSAPGTPVPRDAWIREARKSAATPRIGPLVGALASQLSSRRIRALRSAGRRRPDQVTDDQV